jgi:hypothetical protein
MPSLGPGTELKRLLRKLCIQSTPGCLCDQRALIMDEEGPDWCKDNLQTIVSWMKEEAEIRGLPFSRIAARLLVLRAIQVARKKARILQHA